MTVTIVPVEDPERVRAELREYKRLSEQLRAREAEFAAAYPNEWVACVDGQLFHAADRATFFSQLRQAGFDPAHTPFVHFATDLPAMIF